MGNALLIGNSETPPPGNGAGNVLISANTATGLLAVCFDEHSPRGVLYFTEEQARQFIGVLTKNAQLLTDSREHEKKQAAQADAMIAARADVSAAAALFNARYRGREWFQAVGIGRAGGVPCLHVYMMKKKKINLDELAEFHPVFMGWETIIRHAGEFRMGAG